MRSPSPIIKRDVFSPPIGTVVEGSSIDIPPLSYSSGLPSPVLSHVFKHASPSFSPNVTPHYSPFPSSPKTFSLTSPPVPPSLLRRKLMDRLMLAGLIPPTQIGISLKHANISMQEVTILQLLTIILSVRLSMSSGEKKMALGKGMSIFFILLIYFSL
jgi:hypothetical protein